MKTYLTKRGCALLPVDDEEADAIRKLPDDVVLRAELKRPRSYKNHKHMMLILNYVVNNSDKFRKIDDLLRELKIRMGRCKEYIRSDGVLFYELESISFDSMEEEDFKAFKKEAIDLVLEHYLPGNSLADKDAHFMNIMRLTG